MVRHVVQTIVVLCVASVACAQTATPGRMWYRGPFEGWVDTRTTPAPGYYYHPSPDSAYPLNEAAYGEPIRCFECGHAHFPSKDVCPYCRRTCPAGGNNESPRTVYNSRRLPGYYYYEEQPHYRFASPLRLGPYQKYNRPYN